MKRHWQLTRTIDGRVIEAAQAENGCFTWIHLDGKSSGALRWLREESGVPEHAVRALSATETRPRIEQFDNGALINLRGLGAIPDDDLDELVSIRMWATTGKVVSISFRTLLGIDRVEEQMLEGRLKDPGDLITSLSMQITDRLDPHIAELGDAIDECEADLNPARAWAMRRTIGHVRSQAIGYRRFVAPQRQALERLSLISCQWMDDDDRFHIREAADRFARMAEELEAIRERSALLHEQLTDLRSEMIETRALLISIVALIFLPLTFVTGLLGMNVEGIPYAHEPWAFWGVVIFCVVIAAGISVYFIRARWSRH
jgi:Mg2+ and Co2+ transporters